MKPKFPRAAGFAVLLGAVLPLAACGAGGGPAVNQPSPLPTPLATSAPAVPGKVAWQAPIGPDPVIDGGVIVARATGPVGGVREFDARTGDPRWTWRNDEQPQSLEFLVSDDTVFAVVGHEIGHAPAMVAPVAAELHALDLASGRLLWSHPIAGTTQSPGLAAAGPVIALVDNATPGTVVGLDPRTGARRWAEPAPSTCPAPTHLAIQSGVLLAGAGNALAVRRQCGSVSRHRDVIQNLDPTTGQARWTVPAMAEGDSGVFVAPAGSGVLVTTAEPEPAPDGRPISELAPPVSGERLTAIDLNTGRALWQSNAATVDGDATTLCVTGDTSYQCRHIATGALTFTPPPPARTAAAFVGPTGDSGPVTQADGLVYQLETDGDGATRLLVRSATTGAIAQTEPLNIGQAGADGSASESGLITAGDGLVLVRRADVTGFPVMAMTG